MRQSVRQSAGASRTCSVLSALPLGVEVVVEQTVGSFFLPCITVRIVDAGTVAGSLRAEGTWAYTAP